MSLYFKRLILGKIILLFFVLQAPHAVAQQVLVNGQKQGQGILRHSEKGCFVIAPAHVVASDFELEVFGSERVSGRANFETTYPSDIAILRVTTPRPICADQWEKGERLPVLLSDEADGYLQTIQQDGSVRRRPVMIVEYDPRKITVRPLSSDDSLFQGLSGSILYSQKTILGMLMSINPETGAGKILRQDHLTNNIAAFFNTHQTIDLEKLSVNIRVSTTDRDAEGYLHDPKTKLAPTGLPDIAICIQGKSANKCVNGVNRKLLKGQMSGWGIVAAMPCKNSLKCVFKDVFVPDERFTVSVFDVDASEPHLIANGLCGVNDSCVLNDGKTTVNISPFQP